MKIPSRVVQTVWMVLTALRKLVSIPLITELIALDIASQTDVVVLFIEFQALENMLSKVLSAEEKALDRVLSNDRKKAKDRIPHRLRGRRN